MRAVDRRLIAVDTSFIISLRGGDGEELKARAQHVLEVHKQDLIVIPAPALAECLPGQIPPGLDVLDMTPLAARIASTFKGALKNRPQGVSKRELSIDLFILATAEAHGAHLLFTRDEVFARISAEHSLRVRVRDLPPRPAKQSELILLPSAKRDE